MQGKWITSLATIMLGLAVGCAQQANPAPVASAKNPGQSTAKVAGAGAQCACGGAFCVKCDAMIGSQDGKMTLVMGDGKDSNVRFGPMTFKMTMAKPAEKAAFLGVATSPVNPALRAQLNLEKGMGLMVDEVEKGSPAEAAGIKQFDVIQLLGDQMIVD